MTERPSLGKAGEPVPVVDPQDLKILFDTYEDATKQGIKTLGPGSFIHTCKTGADLPALWFRYSMLQLFLSRPVPELAPWMEDGKPDDVIFHEVSMIPMVWIGGGASHHGPPFDPEELFRRITGTAA
jgi:hypothetical protein